MGGAIPFTQDGYTGSIVLTSKRTFCHYLLISLDSRCGP